MISGYKTPQANIAFTSCQGHSSFPVKRQPERTKMYSSFSVGKGREALLKEFVQEQAAKVQTIEDVSSNSISNHVSSLGATITAGIATNGSISTLIFQLAETEKANQKAHDVVEIEELEDQFLNQANALLVALQEVPTNWWKSSDESERKGRANNLYSELGLLSLRQQSLSPSSDEEDDGEGKDDEQEENNKAKNVGGAIPTKDLISDDANVATIEPISNLILQMTETKKAKNKARNINDLEYLKDQFKMQAKTMIVQLQNIYPQN